MGKRITDLDKIAGKNIERVIWFKGFPAIRFTDGSFIYIDIYNGLLRSNTYLADDILISLGLTSHVEIAEQEVEKAAELYKIAAANLAMARERERTNGSSSNK